MVGALNIFIQPSLEKKTYEVTLSFNIDGDLESWKCTCPESDLHEGLCEHSIATFLKMYDRQEKELESSAGETLGWPFTDPTIFDGKIPVVQANVKEKSAYDPNAKVDNLLAAFEHALDSHEKNPIHVEFQLEFGDHVSLYGYSASLSLRIGLDRLYIVKDIKNFLRCIVDEDREFYTKNFEFDGKRHTFDEKSLSVINMLIDIYEDEIIRENSRYLSAKSSHVFDRKYVLLSSHNFGKLIKSVDLSKLFITDGSNMYQAKVVNETPVFDFYIEDFEEQICIRLNDNYEFRATDKAYKILFDGHDTLYKTKRNDREALMKIDDLFHINQEILLPMQRVEDLANTVFPVLKKVGQLHISETLSSRMVERHLEKRLYMDYSKDGIAIKLQFAYGDILFDPAEERNGRKSVKESVSEDIIIRDTATERAFLSTFGGRIF